MDTAAGQRFRAPSRRFMAGIVGVLLLAGSLTLASWLYHRLDLERGPNQYNIAEWELRHFPEKWLFLFGQLLRGAPAEEEQDEILRRFFDLSRRVEDLERGLSDDPANNEAVSAALAPMLREREAIENQAEASLEARLSQVASEAGLTRTPLDIVWPPPDTEFTRSPYSLVTSPRSRIELLDATLLRDDLSLADVEAIEVRTEAPDVAALAFPVGGIGAYPTIVDYPTGYRRALEVVAHEWMHNFLFFYPLGLNYYASNDLRAINETVADLVARELAGAVIARWPLEPEVPASPPSGGQSDSRFDITESLRALRIEVDALLAAGKIEEAEVLMEQRRRDFAAQGYYFRKLNQAYFAFTNLYAGQAGDPSAVNPIGPKVDELRRRSASLRDFIERVSGVTSVEDLDGELATAQRTD